MKLRKLVAFIVLFAVVAMCPHVLVISPAVAAGREIGVPDVQFQPSRPTHAVTIREAVDIALRNYPLITQKVFKLKAAQANVKLAKTQYLPNLNLDIQESASSSNRIASIVMNNVSGFDTVPVDAGPVANHRSLKPDVNNLEGLNFNWLLIDQGLRKSNDDFAYADARTARADINITKLDVAFEAADAFLDSVAAKQVIISTTAALEHMQSADQRAKTLVAQGIRPAVDTADWDYEVAKTEIALVRAEKNTQVSLVELAEKMGLASQDVDIISEPLIHSPVEIINHGPTDLSAHPLALFKTAEIDRWRAKQVVLNKAYRPHMWLNSSIYGLGSNSSQNIIPKVAGGALPQVFNYMAGVTYSFPFMEYFPLKAQKEMARSNELAAAADFELAMQVLEKKDARARVLLKQTQRIANKTPTLVQAAKVREIQVLKRYSTGLTNMVSLADAERALAEAQVEDALAQVEVWRSILHLAYAQGDLKPFLQVVEIAEGDTTRANRER
ncbi:MAG TPA: TolC family protein [Oculatellaceae cyanobacterium]